MPHTDCHTVANPHRHSFRRPSLAALTPKDPAQQTLVGRSILFCWSSVGWHVGLIKEANGDRRRKMDGEVINFFVHYEIDDNTSAHVLALATYGGEDTGSWVLLEPELE